MNIHDLSKYENIIIIGDEKVGRTEVISNYFVRKKINFSVISLNPVLRRGWNSLKLINIKGKEEKKYFYETLTFNKEDLIGFKSLKLIFFYLHKIKALIYFKKYLNINQNTLIISVGNALTFCSFIVFKLFYIRKPKSIYYNIDYWSYKPGYFGNYLGSHYIFTFISRFLESFLITFSNHTWFVTDVRKKIQNLIKKDNNKFFLMPIGFSYQEVMSFNNDKIIPLNRIVKIFYIGVISDTQGLDLLIKMVLKFKGQIFLELIGQGAMLDKYKYEAKKLGIEKFINFYGFIDKHEDCFKIARKCHFGYAYMHNDQKTHSNFAEPGKIKLYLMFNLPVIVSDHIKISKQIKKLNLGIVIKYGLKTLNNNLNKILEKKIDYESLKKSIFNNKRIIISDHYFDNFFKNE